MAPSSLLIAFPMLSFLVLLFCGNACKKTLVSFIGILGIALSAMYAMYLLNQSFRLPPQQQILWTIVPDVGLSFSAIDMAFYLDPLSLIMAVVVTFVSLWIALYSAGYMAHEEGLVRFFAAINLFVAFMLTLVLADNLVVLFIGWEGVGICSYLLIGFYYREKEAQHAAMKAFLTTRVGDIFLLFAIFLCLILFHTSTISDINTEVAALFPDNSLIVTVIALCLVGGAIGKSAQIPLSVWLPDAMWGPTPVSALIHAATMVTAGVYLLARMFPIVELSTNAQMVIFCIGATTLLVGGLSALVQRDLKRVLAYSTMSQIGYMFLAIGVQAPKAAVFHLTTHAFFKALLFLSAGVIGHAVHTYDMSKMGGLYKKMPLVSTLFLVGCMSLVGIPLVSSGFFSKEWILGQALSNPDLGLMAYSLGVFGVFLTGLYTTRMVMLVFFGECKTAPHSHAGAIMTVPLLVLACFSIGIGWLETPLSLGHSELFSHYLQTTFIKPSLPEHENILMLFAPSIVSLIAIGLGVWWARKRLFHPSAQGSFAISLLQDGGGLNRLYLFILVKPYVALAHAARHDFVEYWLEFKAHYLKKGLKALHNLHLKSLSNLISFLLICALALASAMVLS